MEGIRRGTRRDVTNERFPLKLTDNSDLLSRLDVERDLVKHVRELGLRGEKYISIENKNISV